MSEINSGAKTPGTVHVRLAQIDAEAAGSYARDQRLIDSVYLRRARQLAQRQTQRAASSTIAVLVFGLGAERYGIELSALAEVLPYRGCTAVPGGPATLLGVMNVRGDIRAVADLSRILGLPDDNTERGYVVMLRQPERAMGLRIESIDDVRHVEAAPLTTVERDGAAVPGAQFIKAVLAGGTMLIDTNAVLSSFGLAIADGRSDGRRTE